MKPFVITAFFAAAAALMAFQSVADPLSPLDVRALEAAELGGGVDLELRRLELDPAASYGGHEGLPWGLTVSRSAIHSLDGES